MSQSKMTQVPTPINVDFKETRSSRQEHNDKTLYDCIMENDMKAFEKNINSESLKTILKNLELTQEELLKKCREDVLFCKAILMPRLSKNASRQGSKDEAEQIRACNATSQKCGVSITNLSATAFRPTKTGEIVSNKEKKEKNIKKDCCLKSFDAVISGKMTGYITAKVAYGSGGHQDNVFEEMDTIAEWWQKYKCATEEVLVILIDTDLSEKFSRIKEKYKDIKNIKVCSHVELQEYIIDTYYCEESM